MTLPILRAAAAAALLALCAPPDGRSQATNLPTRVSTSFALSTNGVVRSPLGPVYWPTQTNYIHHATVTNLVIAGTVTGLGAASVGVTDSAGWWASNTVEGVLAEVGVALDSIAGDVLSVGVTGGLLTVTDSGGPDPVIGLTTNAVRAAVTNVFLSASQASSQYVPKTGALMAGNLNFDGNYGVTNLSLVLPSIAVSPMSGSGNSIGSNSIGWDRVYATSLHPPDSFGVTNVVWVTDGALAGSWYVTEDFEAKNITADAFIGGGAGLTGLDAGNLASGTVPTARLGSGTADGTTFLRGDGTWAAAGLTAFTESLDTAAPNNTRNNARLLATGAGANIAVTFQPKGTGGISGQRPDSAASGGNVRGEYAVDWQLARADATQVASGNYSTVAGGYRNKATSLYDVVIGGDRSEATGGFGSIAGGYVARAQSTTALALGNGPTAAHSNSAAFGFDSSSGPTTDRAEQVKFRTGSITLQTDTGTLSFWGKQSSAPGSPAAGDMYYDTGTNKMRCYDGTNWNDLW